MQTPRLVKVLVLERDPDSARAVAALALEAIPQDAQTIVAKATTVDGAKRIIEGLAIERAAPLIVVCAADIDDDGRALEIVDFARRQHPTTRAVVLTDGESRQFRRALELGVDGLHERESGLEGLRKILAYLAMPHGAVTEITTAPTEDSDLRLARDALATALAALEEAHDHLTRAILDGSDEAAEAERRVRHAHRDAVLADRAALEAERISRNC